jgi:hypothetical protein
MRILMQILFFVGLLSLAQCGGYNLANSPYWKTMRHSSEITDYVLKENRLFMFFYHTTGRKCSECESYANRLTELGKKYGSMIKLVNIDCHRLEATDKRARASLSNCYPKVDHTLPIINLYAPPASKVDGADKPVIPQPKLYEGAADLDSLEKFVTASYPFYGKRVTSFIEFNKFMDDDTVPSKILAFLDLPNKSEGYPGLPMQGIFFISLQNSK